MMNLWQGTLRVLLCHLVAMLDSPQQFILCQDIIQLALQIPRLPLLLHLAVHFSELDPCL